MTKAYDIEFSEILGVATDKLISLADKYGENRDEMVKEAVITLNLLTTIGTFKNYKYKNQEE